MQLALWAVGLSTLFLQDFLNVAGVTARIQGLHPRQAKLLDALSEYEIVTPTRVNEFGEPFPSKVHFQRTKRSLPLDPDSWGLDATSSSSSSSSPSTTQAHYKLLAFGQHFFFNLTAQSGFIAPLFTVSFLGEPGINQTNFYPEEASDIKHCFYRGHVNTKPQHTAVISLCSGMAAVDACKLMGYRKYYKQILQDELNFKRYGVIDQIDVATVKDYMQYNSHLDETPAYFGGRHNYWRRLSLENFPRTMIMYDIMEYAQCGKMSARLRCELPFLLLKPENEETYHAQLMAVCQIRFVTPKPTKISPPGLGQQSAPRCSERRSSQARRKIAKMRKSYKLGKEKTEQKMSISTPLTGHQKVKIPQEGTAHQTLFVEEEWEKEAAKLFAWSKSLEDIGDDL